MRIAAMEHYLPHYTHQRPRPKHGTVRLAAVFVESGTARLISEEEAVHCPDSPFPAPSALRRPRASRRLVKHMEPRGHTRVRPRICEGHNLRRSLRGHLVRHMLVYLTLFGVLVGLALGFALRPVRPSDNTLVWLGFPGYLFLRLLQMMIVPLVLTSIISGTASLDVRSCGKIGLVGFIFIVLTNILGTALGLVLALLTTPGYDLLDQSSALKSLDSKKAQDIIADFLRNMIPDNIVLATIRQTQTEYLPLEAARSLNTTAGVTVEAPVLLRSTVGYVDSTNVLGLACFALLVGIATSLSGDAGKPFLTGIRSLTEIIFIILRWILWSAPVGITSLIAASVASVSQVEPPFIKLVMLVVTVVTGLVLQQVLVYPILYAAFTRRNPLAFYRDLASAWGVSWASASTAIAMPELYKGLDAQTVDKRVSRFLVPLGVTTSADGSVCFLAAGVLFLAQMAGRQLDFGQVLTVGVVTSLSGLALPAVPGASLVMLVVIVTSLSIPARNIGLLFIVEWFLDKMRTTSNVMSVAVGAAVTSHLCQEQLQRLDAREIEEIESTPDTGTTDLTSMTDVKELA